MGAQSHTTQGTKQTQQRHFLSDSVRVALKTLAEGFIDDALHEFMKAVFNAFEKERISTVSGDYLHFFQLCAFFLEFEIERISFRRETFSKKLHLFISTEYVRFLQKKLRVRLYP